MFVEASLLRNFEGVAGLNVADVRRESSIALGHSFSKRKSIGQSSTPRVRVSAEERSCLEGVYTVRRSEDRRGMSQRRSASRKSIGQSSTPRVRVSAEERSCLEGLYTVRRSEDRRGMSQRRTARELTTCCLIWLGPVAIFLSLCCVL